MLPFKALNAASDTGPGPVCDMEVVRRLITVAAATSGSPTDGMVYVEGSLDGETWFRLGGLNVAADPRVICTTDTNPHAVRYLRCYLEGLTGGTNPRVTAHMVGADD